MSTGKDFLGSFLERGFPPLSRTEEQSESGGGGLNCSEARQNGGPGLALELKLRPFKHQRNGYL